MNRKLQRRVQRYGWDRACEFYELFWKRQLEPAQVRMLERAALVPGETVLDVAAGTGLVTLPAAGAVGPSGRVVATDLSARMVEEGARFAAAAGAAHVDFRRMDAEALTFEDASFDAVLCALGLMYFPSLLTALREMQRVLRPGGRLAVCVWGSRSACGWAEIFPIVDSRVETEVCPMFFQLGTGDALATALDQAGFEDVDLERLATRLEYESPEAACGAAFAGGPVALAYSRFDDATREEAHADYLASIEPYRVRDGYDLPGEFVIATGRRPA